MPLALLIAALGLTISLILLLAQRIYLVVRILRPVRTVADAADRLAAGDLDVRVREVGGGEVAMLGHAFNEMAGAIQSRDAQLAEARERLEHAVEEARGASSMKSNFLANMSHEVRTPLNGLIGMMNLLADTELTEEQREYVEAANASGDALLTVVNDILDIAKIEAGRLEVEYRDFDLHEAVESTCDMVAASAMSKGLELQSFVHDDVPRAVRGDRVRVSQILTNLISNAVKFTAEGDVSVEVTARQRRESKVEVTFEVRDTGIGIAPERIDHLFEPFTQADAGTTREFGGTGLGLTISLELARLMGGTVSATSELGEGSVFRFTIPFERAASRLRPPMPAKELRGMRVLVVDDNATNRRVFEAYVSSWGMRAEVARDGEEARDRLHAAVRKGTPFDVALIDLNLPDEDGLALARRITATAALRHTRLILLTSSGHTAAEDGNTGIRHHLTKPVRQSRLLDAIGLVMAQDLSDVHQRDRPAGAVPITHRPAELTAREHCILVAEDQYINWMLIERMLAKRGHRAVNAADGRSAIEMLERDDYDLVLMDCQMPSVDGYDATKEIRRREARAHRPRVPIVAMTANAMRGERDRCIAAGMDDYLSKPIDRQALDSVLARWLPTYEALATPLDPRRLGEMRELFPGEAMPKMLRHLQAEVSSQLEAIDVAVDREDRTAVADAAHRILNSATLIGAGGLREAAERLDRLAKDEHANGSAVIAEAVQAVLAGWQQTSEAIEAELEQLSAS